MPRTWARRLAKIGGYGILVLVVLAALAINFIVGWRPVIGAKKRPLTARKFESTPERLLQAAPQPLTEPVAEPYISTPAKHGAYLAEMGTCADCHTPVNPKFQPIAGMELAGITWWTTPSRLRSANFVAKNTDWEIATKSCLRLTIEAWDAIVSADLSSTASAVQKSVL